MFEKVHGDGTVLTPSDMLYVGDIVKINQNEDIPADLILLSTSNAVGTCTINTANLDGSASLFIAVSLPLPASSCLSLPLPSSLRSADSRTYRREAAPKTRKSLEST